MPGPTQTPIQTGLGGAIGCDFALAKNQLFFVEFATGKFSSLTVPPAPHAYSFGTGYNQPEDVRLSNDGVHAYITERTGDLVKVPLATPDHSKAVTVATGLTAPQQLFLDEAHGVAYTVEYASPGSLVRIELATGVKTVVTAALDNPIGVVLTANRQYAYVSEQTTGPDKGRISRIQLSTAGRTTLAKGLTNPFFLTWADAAQDSLFVPQRDPANSIVQVNVTSGAVNTFVTGVPFRPSCVAAPYAGLLIACCDSVVETITTAIVAAADLLMGIGLIPATNVSSATGLATTPSGSPYQVTDAPFGGLLPIMVNFELADTESATKAAFYQVKVDGVVQTGHWNVYFWTGVTNVLQTISPAAVGGTPGCFPVHSVAELFSYQPPNLGYELDSTVLSGGFHTIELQFLDSSGKKLTPDLVSTALKILVDNEPCVATVAPPTLLLTPPPVVPPTTADPTCGYLRYNGKTASIVSLPYTASQPNNHADFSISLARGVTPVGPPPALPSGVSVTLAASPITATVAQLIGPCPTAGFALEVYVAATMTNGLSRQSQYDAEALEGFVLSP